MVNHSGMLATPLAYGCNSPSTGLKPQNKILTQTIAVNKQQKHSAEQIQLQYSPYALTSVTYKYV